jgi:ABC-type multidrug transport system fused ATPase/permease subunit
MIETYKKLFSFLEDKSKRHFFYFLPLLLFTSLFEVVSIISIIPLLSAAFDSTSKWADTMTWVSVYFVDMDKRHILFLLSFIFLGLFVFKNCFILAVTYFITRFTLNNQAHFQQLMFKMYAHRSYPFHLKRNSSDLIRDLANSIGTAFEGLRLSMVLLMDILLSIAAFLVLFVVEPKASLIFSLALIALGFIIFRFMAPMLRRLGARSYGVEGKVIKSINQVFGAIKEIKVLNKQNFFLRGFALETNEFAKITTLSITAKQSPRLFIEVFIVTGFLFFFALLFEMRDTMEEIFATVGLFGLMPSINRILSGMNEIKERTALVASIYADYQGGLDDLITAEASPHDTAMIFNKEIKLKGLFYNYETEVGGKPVLANVNFKIFKGQSIGIVGPSGAGKTTLIDIILGLLRPVQGEILVDGSNIFTNVSGWQKRLGYVPQQIYLIDDTVRRNIAFGVDDTLIDDARLEFVIGMANLKNVVEELPKNLDTILGEQGIRISGGQRQRIGIARALYHDPDVIVFDEATSALDSEAEYEISQAIHGLAQEKTLIIIAHRLSTVRMCEKLIFLNRGQITDMGTFDELIDINADFRRMVKLNDLSGEVPALK